MSFKYSLLFALAALYLWSCAGKSQGLLNHNLSTAFNLREHCVEAKITTGEVVMADSLLKSAVSNREQENFEDAEWQSELASTYYKIGILKSELSKSEKSVKKLQTELAADKEKLNGLLDVYEEIKSLRKQ